MSARFAHRFALMLLLIGAAACTDAAPKVDDPELPDHVAVQVGAKGGTLKTSGMTLEIPEGALDKNIKISATNAGQTAPKEIRAKQVSDLYEFGPKGTRFNKDVKIVFDTAKHEPRAEVYFTKEDGSGFEKIKSEKSGTRVTAFVKHFSQGFVGIPLDDERDAGEEPEIDAGEDAEVVDGMDAGSTLDADIAPDAGDAGATQDAEPTQPSDAGAEAAADAGPPRAHIVVNSRDIYGSAVNQTWAAFQDGTGAWQALPAPATVGSYEFDVAGSSFGVAFVCSTPDLVDSWGTVTFEPSSTTTLAVTAHGAPCTVGSAPVVVNLQGQVTIAPDTYFRMGSAFSASGIGYFGGPASLNTNLHRNVADDLVLASGPTASFMSINRILVVRDVTIAADTTGFNRGMDAGVAPQTIAQADVLNGSAATTVDVRYLTRNTEDGMSLRTSDPADGGTTRSVSFATLPEGVRRPSDRYFLVGTDTSGGDHRQASLRTYPSGNLSVALPPTFATNFSSLTTPYLRPTYTFTPVAGASGYTFSAHYSPVRDSDHVFDMEIDPALLGAGIQTLVFPDFSQVAGFQMAWVAPTNGSVSVKSSVRIAQTDATGDLESESGQSTTLNPP